MNKPLFLKPFSYNAGWSLEKREGWIAWEDGMPIESCPYNDPSESHYKEEWVEGWREAAAADDY